MEKIIEVLILNCQHFEKQQKIVCELTILPRQGLIIGAIIRYGFSTSSGILHMPVVPSGASQYNESVPPDSLWLSFPENKDSGHTENKTFAYSFRGEIYKGDSEIDLKVPVKSFLFQNRGMCKKN